MYSKIKIVSGSSVKAGDVIVTPFGDVIADGPSDRHEVIVRVPIRLIGDEAF